MPLGQWYLSKSPTRLAAYNGLQIVLMRLFSGGAEPWTPGYKTSLRHSDVAMAGSANQPMASTIGTATTTSGFAGVTPGLPPGAFYYPIGRRPARLALGS